MYPPRVFLMVPVLPVAEMSIWRRLWARRWGQRVSSLACICYSDQASTSVARRWAAATTNYSEDPLISGEAASGVINGLQQQGTSLDSHDSLQLTERGHTAENHWPPHRLIFCPW